MQTLVLVGGNPVVDAPADVNFGDLLSRVPHTIRLGLHEDESAALCEWRLPSAHYLESWGDAESADGSYSVVQPLIAPLFGGRSALELTARLIQYETTQPYEIVLRSFAGAWGRPRIRPHSADSFTKGFGLTLPAKPSGAHRHGQRSPRRWQRTALVRP